MGALMRRMPGTVVAGMAVVATSIFLKKNVSQTVLLLKESLHGKALVHVLYIAFILANIKVLPFIWHLRVLNGVYRHVISRRKFTPENGPSSLFQPLITSTHAPFLECDYNIHKSNSTYISDLDVSRAHLVPCLCANGMAKIAKEAANEAPGGFSIALGAVSCSFRRQIGVYESYEIWSRILCWDRKWLYVVSHFVRKGAVEPKGYTLTSGGAVIWLKGLLFGAKKTRSNTKGASEKASNDAQTPHKDIFATGLSRYVFKKGRLTIAPERILDASGLLPPRPSQQTSESNPPEPSAHSNGSAIPPSVMTPDEAVESSLEAPTPSEGVWDWERVEAERLRGLKMADAMAQMESLHSTFSADERPALGRYRDLLWA